MIQVLENAVIKSDSISTAVFTSCTPFLLAVMTVNIRVTNSFCFVPTTFKPRILK